MVGMMMGIENMCQLPLTTIEFGDDGIGIGRIDGSGETCHGIMQQEAVVITEAGKLCDLKLVHGMLRPKNA